MDNAPEGLDPETFKLLKKKYAASVPIRLKEIQEAIRCLEKEFSGKNLTQLAFLVHKTGGSAGTFGFPQVTPACRELESEINLIIKGKREVNVETFLSQVKEFYRFLEKEFNQ